MRFISLCFFLSFLLSPDAVGQTSSDSLVHKLATMRDDTSKVIHLSEIAFELRLADPEKATKYAEQCLKLAERIGWERGKAIGHNSLGNCYKAASNYPTALKEYFTALAIFEGAGTSEDLAVANLNIGTVYRPLEEYQKALIFYDKALKLAEKAGNSRIQALALGNKGVVFFQQERFKEQILVNQKALELFRKIGDLNNEAWILANQGDAYAVLEDFQKGIKAHLEAIAIYEKLNNQSYKATSLLNIGWMYQDLAKAEEEGAERTAFLKQSIAYLERAINLLEKLKDTDYLKDAYLALSDSQKLLGDYEGALRSYQSYAKFRDQVFSQQTKETVAKLETKRELDVKQREIEIERLRKRTEYIYFGAGILLLFIIIGFIVSNNRKQRKLNKLLNQEKQKSEDLLHNILPEEVADELKVHGQAQARSFDEVTVLFTDFKGFTTLAEQLSPTELVSKIDECFRVFDNIMEKYGVEKIKTIGDAYMAAGGLPIPGSNHASNVVNAALEIRDYMTGLIQSEEKTGQIAFRVRIGIHTGPVVAGIVGVKKFAYDIWGDTVNTASRMESSGEAGQVNISHATYLQVKDEFTFEHRGKIAAKNKGEIEMYFVDRKN